MMGFMVVTHALIGKAELTALNVTSNGQADATAVLSEVGIIIFLFIIAKNDNEKKVDLAGE